MLTSVPHISHPFQRELFRSAPGHKTLDLAGIPDYNFACQEDSC